MTPEPAPPAAPRPFHTTLYFRVLVAIALGAALGAIFPDAAAALDPIGKGFIALVKMTIAPLIFCTVVSGIAGMTGKGHVGKVGGLAILYFEVASTLALIVGLVIVNVVAPGAGMGKDPSKLDTSAIASQLDTAKHGKGAAQFVLELIPDTFFGPLANGNLIAVLLVAVLFGFALHAGGERARPVTELVERVGHVMFDVVALVMKLAPLGAFGAMAFTVGKYGVGALEDLGKLLACFYATCLIFIFGVLGAVARLHGFSVWRFVRYIREELFVVLGTSSSESVLPRMMGKLEMLGAGRRVVGLVVPAGYSFNLDGTAIYVTMGAVFIAQATGTPFGLGDQLALLGTALLSSKGAAGVTGSGFVTLAATLSAVGHVPVAGCALIFGIDRFMSEARALTNVIGNGVATLVVARWCRDLDAHRLTSELAAGPRVGQTPTQR